MLLALWFDFWNSGDWIPPVISAYWNALTGESQGLSGGGDIEAL